MDSKMIYVVDDDDGVRRSVAFMLRHEGYSVETYSSGVSFLKGAKKLNRGCVLLDIRMPDMDGLAVQQNMMNAGIDMPVIILTGHGDVTLAVTAMRAGALSFIEKPYDKAELITALEEGFERLSNNRESQMLTSEAKTLLAKLTGRERDVLDGLVRGHPNKTIAYDLGISARTVEIYRANMMDKLHARSLSDALRISFIAEGLSTTGKSI